MEKSECTRAVGQKFNPDGSVRRFAGNTVISKIAPQAPMFQSLVNAQERLKNASWASKYASLPTSSFHMMVIEGLCDQARKPELWSSKLAIDLPLDQVNAFVPERFPSLSLPQRIEMRIRTAETPRWLTIGVEPADAETASPPRHPRNRKDRMVFVGGPRQVGKTTMALQCLGAKNAK